jgi:uncharacterized SAM-binding protein YcdF (DUF218 family)
MGIPDHSFKLIGNGTTSTFDEANGAKKFANENTYKSIFLVTSKWYSKRTHLIFKSAFRNGKKKFISHPSKYNAFNPDEWWKEEKTQS